MVHGSALPGFLKTEPLACREGFVDAQTENSFFGHYFLLPNVPSNVSYLAVCGSVIPACMRAESLRMKRAAKSVDPACGGHAVMSGVHRGAALLHWA
jgi:hypothetical protein